MSRAGNRSAMVERFGGLLWCGCGNGVDDSIFERFPSIKAASGPHVAGNLLGRLARNLGQARVESPEQVLLVLIERGNPSWSAREVCHGLGESKTCVRRGEATVRRSHDPDRRTTDLPPTMYTHGRTGEIERVD